MAGIADSDLQIFHVGLDLPQGGIRTSAILYCHLAIGGILNTIVRKMQDQVVFFFLKGTPDQNVANKFSLLSG